MKSGIQVFLQEMGEAACYALCIVRLAEVISGKEFCALEAFELGTGRGFIHYNAANMNDNMNCYVKDPAAFLSALIGGRWSVEKVASEYKPLKGEFVVDRWERVTPKGTSSHFRLPDWDPYPNTLSVRMGMKVSRRVFRRLP